MFLNADDFSTVVSGTPLISIDLVIENTNGEVLLGMRTNRPAKGFWFVPGGRILKDETLDQAFDRLTQAELNVQYSRNDATFLGVYQHFYSDSAIDENTSTHYVVLAYRIRSDLDIAALPISQHNHYCWFEQNALLRDPKVHTHTKWYIEPTDAEFESSSGQ